MVWLSAKSKTIKIENATIDYVVFGKGDKALVVIPGLGDGLRTVKGLALPLAYSYRQWGKHYKVYMFSRKSPLPENCNSEKLADDLATALENLGITNADLVAVSQGGTVAQYIAIKYSHLVNKMVLAVTYARADDNIKQVVGNWIDYVKAKDYKKLFIDTAQKTYSAEYRRCYGRLSPLLAKFAAPKDDARFLSMAKACIAHNATDRLSDVKCPVLIIAGGKDKIVTPKATVELAEKIPHSKLFMYNNASHSLYEEEKDFNTIVLNFLQE